MQTILGANGAIGQATAPLGNIPKRPSAYGYYVRG
jgi:hypothetical protein